MRTGDLKGMSGDFSWGDMSKCQSASNRAPTVTPRARPTQVKLSEPVSLLGLLTELRDAQGSCVPQKPTQVQRQLTKAPSLGRPAGTAGSLSVGKCPLPAVAAQMTWGSIFVDPVSIRSFRALVSFLCFLSPGGASSEKECLILENSYTTRSHFLP